MPVGVIMFVAWIVFMAITVVGFVVWLVREGQHKNIEEAKYRMLLDREPEPWPGRGRAPAPSPAQSKSAPQRRDEA